MGGEVGGQNNTNKTKQKPKQNKNKTPKRELNTGQRVYGMTFSHPVPAQGYCHLPTLKVKSNYDPVLCVLHKILSPYSKRNSLAIEGEGALLNSTAA